MSPYGEFARWYTHETEQFTSLLMHSEIPLVRYLIRYFLWQVNQYIGDITVVRWRYGNATFSPISQYRPLLKINWLPVDSQRIGSVVQIFDGFFVVSLDNRLKKPSSSCWNETPWLSCDIILLIVFLPSFFPWFHDVLSGSSRNVWISICYLSFAIHHSNNSF